MVSLLEAPDSSLLIALLDAIEAILRAGEAMQVGTELASNPCSELLEECGGCTQLEGLQMHENTEVYEKAGRPGGEGVAGAAGMRLCVGRGYERK